MSAIIPHDLRELYEKAGQSHVFSWADAGKLSDEDIKKLVEQLRRIDPAAANKAFEDGMKNATAPVATREFFPLDLAPNVKKLKNTTDDERNAWRDIGLADIVAGKASVVVLGGGQATRLQCVTCKGEFEAGWPSHEPLYQIFAERVLRLRYMAAKSRFGTGNPDDVSLPLCIMTSPATDHHTRDYFARNDNFGIPESQLHIFMQSTMPCFSDSGKMLLESASKVAESPDGNGGIFIAMQRSGVLRKLQEAGVEYLQVLPIDNVAARVADPVFSGFCVSSGVDVGSKVVQKTDPSEKVGMMALEKRPSGEMVYAPIEYSELPEHLAKKTHEESDRLVFDAGNTCIHWYRLSIVEQLANGGSFTDPDVPCASVIHRKRWVHFHFARKSIPIVDDLTGYTVDKAALAKLGVTGVKLETFMFDAFPDIPLGKMGVLEVVREDEFFPIKNSYGCEHDSPETALAALTSLHKRWLEQAGASVFICGDGPEGRIEISPMISYAGEDLESFAGEHLTSPLLVLPKEGGDMDCLIGKISSHKAGHAVRITPTVTVIYK